MDVHITGLGWATCIGVGRAAVLESLRSGTTGIRRVALSPEPPVKVAGMVDGFDVSSANPNAWEFPEGIEIERPLRNTLSPHGAYALVAVREALAEAGVEAASLADGRTGLYCASGGSPRMLHHTLGKSERNGWRRGDPSGVVRSVAGTLNFNLAAHFGIRGASCGFVSACSSGSHALGFAYDEIALGRQDRMIVVAAEDCNAESAFPFAAMRALTSSDNPAIASRPFDAARDGFVPAGGAVAMILERGAASPVAQLCGWGQACDGYSVAAPQPEGEGLSHAMENALQASGVSRREIGYVNAHGTSTVAGDRAEALALRRVFSEQGFSPAISSTKALTGHGLSLSGLLEAAVCALALQEQMIPGNSNLEIPDPACEGLNFPRETLAHQFTYAMNNSSGFGGSNVCHILQSS